MTLHKDSGETIVTLPKIDGQDTENVIVEHSNIQGTIIAEGISACDLNTDLH